jgi:type II secretory pathway component PulF
MDSYTASDFLESFPGLLFVIVFCAVVNLVFFGSIVYLIYFLLTLPMRRKERARLFLDLLELGLKDGHSPETTITSISTCRERSLSVGFYQLAANIQQGERLTAALEKVPRLLPPQICSMLKTGERIGDISKVLPACRALLKDGVSQVRGALNYLVLLAFAVTPFTVLVPFLIRVKILPSYKAVFEGTLDWQLLPAFTRFVFATNGIGILIQVACLCLVWLALFAYIGGPRLQGWIQRVLPGVPDWASWQFPWRRKRLHRDFSAMLSILLDANVPEAEAVALAGEATNNCVCRRRANRARSLLVKGVKLPEAIRVMDNSKELSWRLTNALRRGSGFLCALAGWHDTLDAKAFQLEQAAAQIATTVLVLFNGLIVGSIVTAIFLALIQILNEAALW